MVASVAVVAPEKKVLAVYATLAIGRAIAPWLAIETQAWGEFASAIAAGSIAALVAGTLVTQLEH